jgi:hypothetical protein
MLTRPSTKKAGIQIPRSIVYPHRTYAGSLTLESAGIKIQYGMVEPSIRKT